MEMEGVERPDVGGVAGCSLRNVVEARQRVKDLFGKGQARTDERPRPLSLREVMASKTKESGRSAPLSGHLFNSRVDKIAGFHSPGVAPSCTVTSS